MKIINPGHVFELDHLDGPNKSLLTFVKRVGPEYPHNYAAHEGTTTQEVLRALIARMKYVDMQLHAEENDTTLFLLRWALWLQEKRAHRLRGEDFLADVTDIEFAPTCPVCLHVQCTKHEQGDHHA